MEAYDRESRFAEAVGKLVQAFADFGRHIAKTFDHLYKSLKALDDYLEDLDDVRNGDGEPIYHTIAGATMGDTRVWMEEHGCDIESGEDVNHRDSPCIYVNLSETN